MPKVYCPSKLRKGDSIGVVALASPVKPDRLMAGLRTLGELGFNGVVGLEPGREYGSNRFLFSSDSAENRIKCLHDFLLSSDIKAIIAARGAFGSLELIDQIDFELVGKVAKPIVGFSDITAFLNAITSKTGLITFHGSMLTGAFVDYGQSDEARSSVDSLLDLLSGSNKNPFQDRAFENLGQSKSVSGNLIGGSLCMLASIGGAGFIPKFNRKILFIEELGEKPHKILRDLLALKLAGVLDDLKAVLAGDFKDCSAQSGPSVKEVLTSFFEPFSIPVLWGMPFGHGKLNLPLPIGAVIKVNQDNTISFPEALVA